MQGMKEMGFLTAWEHQFLLHLTRQRQWPCLRQRALKVIQDYHSCVID